MWKQKFTSDLGIERELVSSLMIVSIGHCLSSSTLEIEFQSGVIYQYIDVPESVFEAMLDAVPIGSLESYSNHFRWLIRGQYFCYPVHHNRFPKMFK